MTLFERILLLEADNLTIRKVRIDGLKKIFDEDEFPLTASKNNDGDDLPYGPETEYYFAYSNGGKELVAVAAIGPNNNHEVPIDQYIWHFEVSNYHQREGIGAKFVAALKQHFDHLGLHPLDAAAKAFWEAQGFEGDDDLMTWSRRNEK